ncbi:MAG: hypothetical protein HC880_11260 [Bacteroidia bacterium]|nr:hypothetical protein [Bacteroidia bacterium]
MTGANADYRVPVKPSQEGQVIKSLYLKITGNNKFPVAEIDKVLTKAAAELKNNRGKSLVVSGSNDPDVQLLVNAINNELGNYGTTILNDTPSYLLRGQDEDVNNFIQDVKAGRVDAVIFYGTNPVFTHPQGKELAQALTRVPLKISLSYQPNETTTLCDYVCPDNHYLESWNDAQPRAGHYSLAQPAITNIYATRQAQESLLTWAGINTSFYEYIRNYWQTNVFPGANADQQWELALHDGVYSTAATQPTSVPNKDDIEDPRAGLKKKI